MLFKRKRIPFPIPDDARELTEEEMILVNGGGKEQGGQQESQDEKCETQTVKKGDTLSQIVADYNKEHGTDLTVADVAKMSGISNPDLIYPGQKINFGNQGTSGSGTSPQNTLQTSPSMGGNIGSGHTGSSGKNYSEGVSNLNTRPISAATAITPATTASRKDTSGTQTMQAEATAPTSNAALGVPATTINTEPKYESTYYNQIVERHKVHAAKDGIRETSIKGEEISGKQIEGQNIDSHSGNLTERGYPGSRDENLGIYSGTESIETETSLEKMKKSVEKNTKHKYNENASGFMCDNWLERVIDDAGFDSTKVGVRSSTQIDTFGYDSYYYKEIM